MRSAIPASSARAARIRASTACSLTLSTTYPRRAPGVPVVAWRTGSVTVPRRPCWVVKSSSKRSLPHTRPVVSSTRTETYSGLALRAARMDWFSSVCSIDMGSGRERSSEAGSARLRATLRARDCVSSLTFCICRAWITVNATATRKVIAPKAWSVYVTRSDRGFTPLPPTRRRRRPRRFDIVRTLPSRLPR
ncbi:MAG: hypothetical protein E6K75_08930 [Candidatus Eisenbacteria bacterium]|uniref:Uncharacterized protein n=1 Tax=Eiseniibacteriota bacterium TaxID=2212470 RepID=A0A538SXR8_UNCEI|nr:MAG: hypothetical protein E6K75_08930 [Candidatus Eisenbacteria bacterium]